MNLYSVKLGGGEGLMLEDRKIPIASFQVRFFDYYFGNFENPNLV